MNDARTPVERSGQRPRAAGSSRILVVDDEPHITELLAQTLRFAGFEVETAGDGAAAIDTAGSFQPHLCVLDVMLPDMSGFDVCRRLRSGDPSLSFLFLSARDSTEDKLTGLTIGGDDYVTKPFSCRANERLGRITPTVSRAGPEGQGQTAPTLGD